MMTMKRNNCKEIKNLTFAVKLKPKIKDIMTLRNRNDDANDDKYFAMRRKV